MAVTDLATWQARRDSPRQVLYGSKSSLATIAGRMSSLWVTAPNAGAAPSTAAVPTRATAGALRPRGIGDQLENAASIHRITAVRGSCSQPGQLILCDRLSHQGGLSGTVITAQTTNLATAALTRYTSGHGVFAGFEIYTQIGATATTITATYTDDGNNAGNVTPAMVFGGTGFREAGRIIPFTLAAGDAGVRSVASVTVLASTATAGNFGVTLFKPLMVIPVKSPEVFDWDPVIDGGGVAPEIVADACLQWMFMPFTTATGALELEVHLAED